MTSEASLRAPRGAYARQLAAWLCLLAAPSSACGDDASPTGGSGGAGGEAGQAQGGEGGVGAAGGQGGDGGAGASGGNGGADPVGGAGGGAPGTISAYFTAVVLGGNCQPIVGPDPLSGGYLTGYMNDTDQPASLDIVENTLRLDNGSEELVWTFDVLPSTTGVIPANSAAAGDHNKVDGSGSGSPSNLDLCSFCNGPATLTVTFSDGSEIFYDLGTLPCAF